MANEIVAKQDDSGAESKVYNHYFSVNFYEQRSHVLNHWPFYFMQSRNLIARKGDISQSKTINNGKYIENGRRDCASGCELLQLANKEGRHKTKAE